MAQPNPDPPPSDDGLSEQDSIHSSTDSYAYQVSDHFGEGEKFKDAHYDRMAQICSGSWADIDTTSLATLGWKLRPKRLRDLWQVYMPTWTHPDLDPAKVVSLDGQRERAATLMDRKFMRPAILPDDPEDKTSYTLRWGINQDVPPSTRGEARSGLTPTSSSFNSNAASQKLDDGSFQNGWFDGHTTQEVR